MTIHVTTAALIEQNGKFLVVEEIDPIKGRVINQPAGHVEDKESILDAIVREVREETGYQFTPEYLVGIYHVHANDHDATYLRFCISGRVDAKVPSVTLDPDIIAVHWLTYSDIKTRLNQHRSYLVLSALDDYRAGRKYPLDLLQYIGNEPVWRREL